MPDKPYLLVSLILSFIGGFTDAGSYILAGSFTGHITGSSILMMVDAVHADWPHALSCLISIPAFLAGTAAGIAWRHTPGHSPCRRLAPLLAVEIILIGLSLATGPADHNLFLICACLAMGVQNGTVGKIEAVAFHTTFITGLSTSLVSSLVAGKADPKRKLLPPIIGCFLLGAFCGALATARAGVPGFAAVVALLALACAISLAAPSRVSAAE